jgi:hypothetical protein
MVGDIVKCTDKMTSYGTSLDVDLRKNHTVVMVCLSDVGYLLMLKEWPWGTITAKRFKLVRRA